MSKVKAKVFLGYLALIFASAFATLAQAQEAVFTQMVGPAWPEFERRLVAANVLHNGQFPTDVLAAICLQDIKADNLPGSNLTLPQYAAEFKRYNQLGDFISVTEFLSKAARRELRRPPLQPDIIPTERLTTESSAVPPPTVVSPSAVQATAMANLNGQLSKQAGQIKWLRAELRKVGSDQTRLKELQRHVEAMQKEQPKLAEKTELANLATTIEEKLAGFQKRVTAVEEKITQSNTRLTGVEQRVTEMVEKQPVDIKEAVTTAVTAEVAPLRELATKASSWRPWVILLWLVILVLLGLVFVFFRHRLEKLKTEMSSQVVTTKGAIATERGKISDLETRTIKTEKAVVELQEYVADTKNKPQSVKKKSPVVKEAVPESSTPVSLGGIGAERRIVQFPGDFNKRVENLTPGQPYEFTVGIAGTDEHFALKVDEIRVQPADTLPTKYGKVEGILDQGNEVVLTPANLKGVIGRAAQLSSSGTCRLANRKEKAPSRKRAVKKTTEPRVTKRATATV